jgi:hypothetical protein
MIFREWVAMEAEALEVGCGRYEDMRSAYRAGEEAFRERAVALKDDFSVDLMDPDAAYVLGQMVGKILKLPLEGDDE